MDTRPLFVCLRGHRLVDSLMPEQRLGDACRLIGHGDEDDIGLPPILVQILCEFSGLGEAWPAKALGVKLPSAKWGRAVL